MVFKVRDRPPSLPPLTPRLRARRPDELVPLRRLDAASIQALNRYG